MSNILTAEMLREAARKAMSVQLVGDPQIVVHPLRWLFIQRACDPVYCRILGIRLVAGWRQIYEQTFADYWYMGINGYDS